jgi:hypothetical protein
VRASRAAATSRRRARADVFERRSRRSRAPRVEVVAARGARR